MREKKIFSTKPFEKQGSYDLINYCKMGNISKVRDMLVWNKYLIYDFDFVLILNLLIIRLNEKVYLTPLHWAVKRGFYDLAKVLLDNGADVNAKDLVYILKIFYFKNKRYKEHLFIWL